MAKSDTASAGPAPSIWDRLAEPIPEDQVKWRQSTKPKQSRDGKFRSLYVCYIELNTVRERFDRVVPGRWSHSIIEMPAPINPHEKQDDPFNMRPMFAVRIRITVNGPDGAVVRDGVGHGKDYKQATTDSFKRAGVMFGIAAELYDLPKVFVTMKSGERYAEPAESVELAVKTAIAKGKARRIENVADDAETAPVASGNSGGQDDKGKAGSEAAKATPAQENDPRNVIDWGRFEATDTPNVVRAKLSDAGVNIRTCRLTYKGFEAIPLCPTCGGSMIDRRAVKIEKKLNPRSPDWACADTKHQKNPAEFPKQCDGKFWPDDVQIGFARAIKPSLIGVKAPVPGAVTPEFKWTLVEPELRDDPSEKKAEPAAAATPGEAKDDIGSVFD